MSAALAIPPLTRDPDRLRALDAYGILDTPPEPGFDDIVVLARNACAVPVALVSLVTGDRQWFKARVGFPPCETDLDRSVCAYVLAESDLLVIPDLTTDSRTGANPLVTGDPYLRFYAGAPLRTADGLVLGSLCVIDHAPRPAGLTPVQAESLRALARQVMAQMDLRRTAIEREAHVRTLEAVADAAGDLDAILGALVAGAMRAMPAAEGGTLELIDGAELEYRAVCGSLAEQGGLRIPLVGSASGTCVTTGTALLVKDAWTDPRVRRDVARVIDQRSSVHVPVRRAGRVLGVLKLQSRRVAAFSERDLRLATLFAGLANAGLTAADEAMAQRAVQAGETRLRTITDHVGQAVFQMDMRGQVTFTNPAAEAMFGWTAAEMLGRSLHDLIHHTRPDGHPYPAEECPFRRALTSGRLLTNAEETFFHRDGTRVLGLVTNAPVVVDGRVVSAVMTITDITARKTTEEHLARSEARWRGLFATMQEGFFIGELLRDPAGVAEDFLFLEVNPAFPVQTGLPADAAGSTMRELVAEIPPWLIETYARVVDSRVPETFEIAVPELRRHFEARAYPEQGERFSVVFLDVTGRKREEARQAAILALGDRLRELNDRGRIASAAAEVAASALGLSAAGYGTVDPDMETITVEQDWRADDGPILVGLHRFRDYGSYIEALTAGETVVIEDVERDPRTAAGSAALLAIGVRALVNIPVMEHGRFVGLFYMIDRSPRAWSAPDLGFLRNVAERTRGSLARVEAQEHQALLNDELSHRLKNTLAMVQAIASQTLRAVSEQDAVEEFGRRVQALASAHDVLLQQSWASAQVRAVVEAALSNLGQVGRADLDGPDMALGPRATLSLSLLLHELATNALKYGALSNEAGRVGVAWRIDRDGGEPSFVLDWRERGGPPVRAPERRGFGSRLIRTGLVGAGGVELRYPEAGVEVEMRAALTQMQMA
ncbi:GAF domain-containing protein [Methylobacterium sp. J-030]|uniref:GAF domain-containing protein n=1 Tax=Methylobacterium sp. J-030 TaxID=2836627 RepID=UPI001FB9E196|nr:GAF domain-containing protein [Methylobacterium sp. J-030]MCJ2069354.1 GAF domain-containing protein [Methylobacterium sp. J-030]